ncbi:DUF368 domain-containing protein [Oceanotoga sp. DSM 15011]|uniref:DUF368 domain-containing protein n=1 Tax=Oceanotoga TaxID=1255275 RepID=UPI0021F484BF|nr:MULTISPECIES: DUF368 domain-containing protein [Oceanotoga]MDO7977321.1 DUF368 domain-containing protein [Oceanotoga teriensis]UYP00460.1 DUF368 domain-containing protein [Oceanotoga sp. DSM 15011]
MIKNFILGFLIGISNLVPGVSGGTIAVISGKYDEIISSVSNYFSFKFDKKSNSILIPLAIGLILAVFGFSKVIIILFDKFQFYMLALFVGMIFGGLFFLLKKINYKNIKNISFILLFTFIFILLFNLPKSSTNNMNFFYLLFGGIIGSATMVLPGISGSSMLLIMGIYKPVIEAIGDLNFNILIPVALGIIIGIIFIIKILEILLKKCPELMYCLLVSLTFAGGIKIFPLTNNLFVYLFVFVGVYLGYLMDKYFNK